jgi:cholesterol transport system auxiliary component
MIRKPNIFNIFICYIFVFIFIQGCATGGKPSYEIQSYLLDYPAPVLEKFVRLSSTIRFNRFTIAAAYNTQNMIFRSDNYSLDFFNYNRWAVNPADMVADVLLRDMQASRLFHAVLSRYSMEETNFLLEGGIGEFFLRVEKDRKFAVISLEITLKDSRRTETNRRIIFQKKYRHEEVLTEQTPRGYCQSMSQALKNISSQIITDVYQAIKSSVN